MLCCGVVMHCVVLLCYTQVSQAPRPLWAPLLLLRLLQPAWGAGAVARAFPLTLTSPPLGRPATSPPCPTPPPPTPCRPPPTRPPPSPPPQPAISSSSNNSSSSSSRSSRKRSDLKCRVPVSLVAQGVLGVVRFSFFPHVVVVVGGGGVFFSSSFFLLFFCLSSS